MASENGSTTDDRFPGDIGPASQMQEKYGWFTGNRPPRHLRAGEIPLHLRDLMPLAERWGINCDITRHDAADKASPEELADIASRLRGRHAAIEDWLYEFDEAGQVLSDEAAAFQSLLILEAEEAAGPGISGRLTWTLRKVREVPSDVNYSRLRTTCEWVRQMRLVATCGEELAVADELLRRRETGDTSNRE